MNDAIRFYQQLALNIPQWAAELGFQSAQISDVDLSAAEPGLISWLAQGFHGSMDYMSKHGLKRSRPAELVPGTVRVISVRMNYLPAAADSWSVIHQNKLAYISRYALGRDYHKVLRKRLAQLADKIREAAPSLQSRVFTDSAPVMEVALAEKAGIGWRGKHTLLLHREQGSWFFLGEIFVNLPLPVNETPAASHCGRCTRCLDICPTQAIVAPYQLDARRCISYLTIEHKGSIPDSLRPLIGNRIYGCDDCQLVCPWNRFARLSVEQDFAVRHQLDQASLLSLFAWDEATFRRNMAGSPVYRIGYQQWLRNLAVAMGNADYDAEIVAALQQRQSAVSELVAEHIHWALQQQLSRMN